MATRVTKAGKTAENLGNMSARKLILRLMTIAPAIFVGGIAVHARAMLDGWEFVENDPATEKSIQAYGPFVKDTIATLRETHEPSALCALGQRWVSASKDGTLKSLVSISYEDTTSDGVKAQIFTTRASLGNALMQACRKAVAKQDYHAAATCATTSLQLANVGKYSDFIGMYNSATEQRRTLVLVEGHLKELPQSDKLALRLALKEASDTNRPLLEKMTWTQKHNYLLWRDRREFPQLSIEDSKLVSEVPVMLDGDYAVAVQNLRQRALASKDKTVPSYVSSVRLGIVSQLSLQKEIKEIEEKL